MLNLYKVLLQVLLLQEQVQFLLVKIYLKKIELLLKKHLEKLAMLVKKHLCFKVQNTILILERKKQKGVL